jgi:hypothetical protein
MEGDAAFTGEDDFVEREKDGFMGNFQYIANRQSAHDPELASNL